MRTGHLHQTLHAFAEEAGLQLSADLHGGADLPFELVESQGGRTALYCYRPRTDQFIRERLGVLGRLPGYPAAVQALERLGGLPTYLRLRGERRVPEAPGDRADAALRVFLQAVFDDTSDFVLNEERFTRAFKELEQAIFTGRTLTTTVAPVLGVELASPEVPIGEGLALVRGDALDDAPDDAVWLGSGDGGRPNVLAVLTEETRGGEPAPAARARVRFRRLLTALRLFERGGFALGPAAWTRVDAGPWRLVALGGTGRPRGATYRLPQDTEDELRAFVNLVGRRRPRGGEVAWALARFDMACERLAPFEALTDHLLALRALLEPEGPQSGRLAGRLAALCAMPEQRAHLAERTAHAISLERAVIAGIAPAESRADALVEELGDHLRALLRDVLCGHLDADLVAVADDILEAAAPAAGAPRIADEDDFEDELDDEVEDELDDEVAPSPSPSLFA